MPILQVQGGSILSYTTQEETADKYSVRHGFGLSDLNASVRRMSKGERCRPREGCSKWNPGMTAAGARADIDFIFSGRDPSQMLREHEHASFATFRTRRVCACVRGDKIENLGASGVSNNTEVRRTL